MNMIQKSKMEKNQISELRKIITKNGVKAKLRKDQS